MIQARQRATTYEEEKEVKTFVQNQQSRQAHRMNGTFEGLAENASFAEQIAEQGSHYVAFGLLTTTFGRSVNKTVAPRAANTSPTTPQPAPSSRTVLPCNKYLATVKSISATKSTSFVPCKGLFYTVRLMC